MFRHALTQSLKRELRRKPSLNLYRRCFCLHKHSDWDLKELNDEIESIMGHFNEIDANNNPPSPHSQITSPLNGTKSPEDKLLWETDKNVESIEPEHAISNKARMNEVVLARSEKKEVFQAENQVKPLFCILFSNVPTEISSSSDFANVSLIYRSWKKLPKEDFIEMLASTDVRGVVVLEESFNDLFDITPVQVSLLKIFKKSSPVVLVRNVTEKNTVDTSFASHVIEGFGARQGIAAAMAGLLTNLDALQRQA